MKRNLRLGLPMAALSLISLTQFQAPALAQTVAQVAAVAPGTGDGAAALGKPLYQVADGNKVDVATFEGWKTWRAMACERCHGANQEGLVGPSLVNSLKTMSKADFVFTVTHGRAEKGMPNFGEVATVVKNIDNLYAYLKGRSDGAIKPGHVQKMAQQQ